MRAGCLFAVAWGLGLLAGCAPDRSGGACGEDSDCGAGETCLFDLDLETSYCTRRCASSSDCPSTQRCRFASLGDARGGLADGAFCVDRVRECRGPERCNGLDDDCNGVIDDGCALVTACNDDAPCGAYVCQAPVNQPATVCAPPVEGGRSDFGACSQDAECANGSCATGLCAPFCRPGARDACPGVTVDGMSRELVCAEALGPVEAPRRNQCQLSCLSRGECPAGTDCVWRAVVNAEPFHASVCSRLDVGRKPLGEACRANDDAGDAECQHGLCLGRVCTRVCGGPGASCADVGPNFTCRLRQLFYGAEVFAAHVCERSAS